MPNQGEVMSSGHIINLDELISSLEQRWKEIRENEALAKVSDKPGLILKLEEVRQKQTALESIRNHRKAAQILVTNVSNEQKIELKQAIANLSLIIQEEETFENIMIIVKTITDSSDKIVEYINAS